MSFHNCSIHYYPEGLGGFRALLHEEPLALRNSSDRQPCRECKRREMRFILRGNFSDYLCTPCLIEMLGNKPLCDYWQLSPERAENVRRAAHALAYQRTELMEV